MAPADLLAECERVEASMRAIDLDPSTATLQVIVSRTDKPKNWDRVRVMRGVYGRCVGEVDPMLGRRRFMVDVRATAIRAAIRRVAA